MIGFPDRSTDFIDIVTFVDGAVGVALASFEKYDDFPAEFTATTA